MRTISIAGALALVLFAGLMATAQTQSERSSGVRDVDFRNFSYRVVFDGETAGRTIKLSDGKFEDGGMLYELFDKPVYGDVNGDGSQDAVVEIKLSGPPSYRAFEVHAYTLQDGQAKLLARVDDGRVLKDYRRSYRKGDLHYAGVNPPKIQNGHVIVEALMDGSFACPKYTAVFNYKLSGGKIVLTGKPIRKPFKCS